MIVVLSSAKTQNFAPIQDVPLSQPPLLAKTKALLHRCRELSGEEIKEIMKVSDKLAESTFQRFLDFTIPHLETSASPALSTFAGDVFSEIHWQEYRREELLRAHDRVRILSGLYGVLRPLDLMQPYRLEMGYKLQVESAANLYEFWTEAVTAQLNSDLEKTGSSCLVNCASKEYFRSISAAQLRGAVLTLTFKQKKDGKVRSIAIYAKRARGMFVDWFITNQVNEVDTLSNFNGGGYRFSEDLSSDDELVFITEL
ncbi:MAG: peroxide stress protein YaaA [Desulfofustis sp.]|nr:peroxide stress protein YaaA [Desulfofustis sp.]NNK15152.1 peroxide stress protein YaaA [Desulfofustis sp.]